MVDLNLSLPASFFEEEERNGFFISRKQKEVWAVELDLLNEFIRVCDKYDLKYFAEGGTMIGAVRHNGFIPWDDDIDISMFRSDYMKLEEIASKEFTDPYFFQTEKTDVGSMRGHAQLRNSKTTGILRTEVDKKYSFNQGIFLDIFPIDYIPDEHEWQNLFALELHEQREKAFKYTYMTSRFKENGDGFYRIKRRLKHRLLSANGMENKEYIKWENLMMKYNNMNTDTVSEVCFRQNPKRRIWKAEWFADSLEFPFEMLKIAVPIGYDEVLTQLCGDWRTPKMFPSLHGDMIFDVDNPYTEYLKLNSR